MQTTISEAHTPTTIYNLSEMAVIEMGTPVKTMELPAGPKKLAHWLEANKGWYIHSQTSTTTHPDVLYANAGKPTAENPQGTLKGSIKTPAHMRQHFTVQGTLITDRTRVAHLWAAWEKIGGKLMFKDCVHWDLATQERYVDTQVGSFHDWLRILAPNGAPAIRKVVNKPTIDEQILGGDEWQA